MGLQPGQLIAIIGVALLSTSCRGASDLTEAPAGGEMTTEGVPTSGLEPDQHITRQLGGSDDAANKAERIREDLKSVSYPVAEKDLVEKLGVGNLTMLSRVHRFLDWNDKRGYTEVWHQYYIDENCILIMTVYPNDDSEDWIVTGAGIECP